MHSIFIVEDKAITRATLEALLSHHNFNVLGSSASAEEALVVIKEHLPDLVLIDVDLAGEKDGVWLGHKLKEQLELPFIFLTAYDDETTVKRIIDTASFGYLKKPFHKETLLTNVHLALKTFQNQKHSLANTHKFITVKEKHNTIKLHTADITFVKSDGNYIHIHTIKDKRLVVRQKLQVFLQQLPEQHFKQAHLRYLVNVDFVDVIESKVLRVNTQSIPISDTYKKHWVSKKL